MSMSGTGFVSVSVTGFVSVSVTGFVSLSVSVSMSVTGIVSGAVLSCRTHWFGLQRAAWWLRRRFENQRAGARQDPRCPGSFAIAKPMGEARGWQGGARTGPERTSCT